MILERKNATSPGSPRVGVRIPESARHTQGLYRGILDYMRSHAQWQIQAELTPQTRIDTDWDGDGLILFRYTTEEARAFRRKGIPVVCLSAEVEDHFCPSVLPDNFEMGRIVARHFLRIGMKNFAYFGDRKRVYSRARSRGFSQVIREHGFRCIDIPVNISRMDEKRKWPEIEGIFRNRIRQLPKPVGILARDDMLASGIIRACGDMCIQVPDEVAVAGVDNDEIVCLTSSPPLTSIAHPTEAIGYKAAELLASMMEKRARMDEDEPDAATAVRGPSVYGAPLLNSNGYGEPRRIIMPVSGISARESTRTFAWDDELVSDSMHYIHSRAPLEPLLVTDVVDRTNLSHSGFKKRFIRTVGHSPKSEIKRVRREHLKMLLRTTSLSIQTLSERMRFSSTEELSRFFLREVGTTPSNYRKNPVG